MPKYASEATSGRFSVSAVNILSNQLCKDFNKENHNNNDHDRLYDFGSFVCEAVTSKEISDHVTDSCRDSKSQEDFSIHKKYNKRCNICCKVDGFSRSCRIIHCQMAES